MFASSNTSEEGRLGCIHAARSGGLLKKNWLTVFTLSLGSSVNRVFLVHAHEVAVLVEDTLGVVRDTLLSQVGYL